MDQTTDNTALQAAFNELREHAETMLKHFRSGCAVNEDELLSAIDKIGAVQAHVFGTAPASQTGLVGASETGSSDTDSTEAGNTETGSSDGTGGDATAGSQAGTGITSETANA